MTNTCMLKAALMFTGGAVCGWVGAKYMLKTKYEQILEDELQAYKNSIEAQYEGEIVRVEDIPENVVVSDELVVKKAYNFKVRNYAGGLSGMRSEEIGEKPYMIPEADYIHGCIEHDKCDWNYYEVDGVITDENHEPVSDPARTLGNLDTVLQMFGSDHLDDPDTIYVRNAALKMDIELTRFNQSYEEDFNG